MERADITGYWHGVLLRDAHFPCFVVQSAGVEHFVNAPPLFRYHVFVFLTPDDDPAPLPFIADASSQTEADGLAWQMARFTANRILHGR